jgi:hypothetical protein
MGRYDLIVEFLKRCALRIGGYYFVARDRRCSFVEPIGLWGLRVVNLKTINLA